MFDLTPFEIYIFVICFVVFFVFTVLFSVMLGYLVSLNLKLIKCGALDAKIKTEYQKRAEQKHSAFWSFMDRAISILLCLAMCAVFVFSVYLKLNEGKVTRDVPSLKVVQSGSMATKHEKNTYLEGIDNQVQTFDLITTYPLPEAHELKLYDIVMYELNGDVILHRIVKIEEPNANHPDAYWFTLQGDALEHPDTKIVSYSQMLGIYRGERIPFVGSFVMFMQSPAGYLCILLIVVAMIATPLMEGALERAKRRRMEIIRSGQGLGLLRQAATRRLIFSICKRSLLFHSIGFLYWRWLKRHMKD